VKRYLPIFADVQGRTCLVVGGGPVAEGRARQLVAHGALVRLVAPAVTPGLEELITQADIPDFRHRTYDADDLDGCLMAIAATDRRAVNAAVAHDAAARGVLCNVADAPSDGDVLFPAIVRRGDLAFAVTTGGASPAVAGRVRRDLEEAFGPEWGDMLALLADLRPAVKRRHPDPAARAAVVRRLLDEGEVLGAFARGDAEAARAAALHGLGLRGDD
jgi:precorrin-2 dehydrogenase/sirohydrochlorin ferrochelatase